MIETLMINIFWLALATGMILVGILAISMGVAIIYNLFN